MRYVKILLFIAAAMLVMFLFLSAFMPAEFRVEKSIEINCPKSTVFENTVDLNKFNQWNYWKITEPNDFQTVKGDAGMHQSISWNGKKIGSGSITNIDFNQNESINQLLKFKLVLETEGKIKYRFEENAGITKVIWTVHGDLSYPIYRYMKVPYEEKLNMLMDSSLFILKQKCESGGL